jgi:2-oxoglutarate ferredoxin oxidoreductase subunit beta
MKLIKKFNMELSTTAINTWCPGCPNFGILASFKEAMTAMVGANETTWENIVVGTGIGCHGKMSDFINVNTFYALHGRVIPVMTGIKLANPKLTVMAFSGDGDSLAEGIEHLIHAAKRNSDFKIFLHNNQVFGLTTGQVTPTSAKGYQGRTTPEGSVEEPLNPLALLLQSGATFLARSYALQPKETAVMMRQALNHKGFGMVEIIQPCITFNDTRPYFKDRFETLPQDYDASDYASAYQALMTKSGKVKLGVIYQVNKPTFEEQV